MDQPSFLLVVNFSFLIVLLRFRARQSQRFDFDYEDLTLTNQSQIYFEFSLNFRIIAEKEFYYEHEREEMFQAFDVVFQRDYVVIPENTTIESEDDDDDVIHRATSIVGASELRKYCDT